MGLFSLFSKPYTNEEYYEAERKRWERKLARDAKDERDAARRDRAFTRFERESLSDTGREQAGL